MKSGIDIYWHGNTSHVNISHVYYIRLQNYYAMMVLRTGAPSLSVGKVRLRKKE